MFEAARMHIDATYTTQAGEAVGICQQLDRERYDVVVPCSGDGLPHEVFNGLGRRADARAALRQLAVVQRPGEVVGRGRLRQVHPHRDVDDEVLPVAALAAIGA